MGYYFLDRRNFHIKFLLRLNVVDKICEYLAIRIISISFQDGENAKGPLIQNFCEYCVKTAKNWSLTGESERSSTRF